VQWSKGDVLMLDNITVAHGRQPFTGSRRILVAMADPSSPTLAHDEPLG
jgi:alpha-ketoglutarate-dependent taurine dioxygenase